MLHTEKTNYDKVVNEAVRKKEKAAGTDVTTGTNNTKYVTSKAIKDSQVVYQNNVVVKTHFKSARNVASQYLYVGELTGFFSQENNMAVFDVYGYGDYDFDETKQSYFTLVVRKCGQYTDKLYIDDHLNMNIPGKRDLSQATAYFKADGTVRIYLRTPDRNLRTPDPVNYNAVFIKSAINGSSFKEAMIFSESFTAPAGFTKHTTNADIWLPIRSIVEYSVSEFHSAQLASDVSKNPSKNVVTLKELTLTFDAQKGDMIEVNSSLSVDCK